MSVVVSPLALRSAKLGGVIRAVPSAACAAIFLALRSLSVTGWSFC